MVLMFLQIMSPAVRLGAWAGILAVALNAFWPLVAQLKPAQSDSGMQMEGCAGMDMGHASTDTDSSAPD